MLKYDYETCHITYNDKVVGQWLDGSARSYPEDVTWNRDIGILCNELFRSGIEEGKRRYKEENARYKKALKNIIDYSITMDDRFNFANEALKGGE